MLTSITRAIAPGKRPCLLRYNRCGRLDTDPFTLLAIERTDVPDLGSNPEKSIAPHGDDAWDGGK